MHNEFDSIDARWFMFRLRRNLCRNASTRHPYVIGREFAKTIASGILQKEVNDDEVIQVLREYLYINDDVRFNIRDSESGDFEISLIATKELMQIEGVRSRAYRSIVFF